MIGIPNRRLSEIAPEEIAALLRWAHQERSRAVRDGVAATVGWLTRLVREAGVAARLSEAPKPYPASAYAKTRQCG